MLEPVYNISYEIFTLYHLQVQNQEASLSQREKKVEQMEEERKALAQKETNVHNMLQDAQNRQKRMEDEEQKLKDATQKLAEDQKQLQFDRSQYAELPRKLEEVAKKTAELAATVSFRDQMLTLLPYLLWGMRPKNKEAGLKEIRELIENCSLLLNMFLLKLKEFLS